jgi:putative ABC transport system ATP-binding protein
VARLSLTGVEYRFAGLDHPALAIPALTLHSGERVGLTGPSGSGKTTLLNLLTGLERAQTGSILWDRVDLARLGEGGRDRWRGATVGLVLQDFHLIPGLSALDNVLLPQRLRQWRLANGVRGEAQRLLDQVGIDNHAQPVDTLSRGQMQRVALVRAVVARPAIIVADEPTASLDAEASETIAGLLLDLAGSVGATLIVATHDPALLGRFDRVIRLDRGRLISHGADEC